MILGEDQSAVEVRGKGGRRRTEKEREEKRREKKTKLKDKR
jgi:hypothetical protein